VFHGCYLGNICHNDTIVSDQGHCDVIHDFYSLDIPIFLYWCVIAEASIPGSSSLFIASMESFRIALAVERLFMVMVQ